MVSAELFLRRKKANVLDFVRFYSDKHLFTIWLLNLYGIVLLAIIGLLQQFEKGLYNEIELD